MPLEFMSTLCEGQKLYGVIHFPRRVPAPLVIASHGLLSSKDSEKFVLLGELFSEGGIALLRYDHRGCGESEGDLRSTTPTSRLKDLEAIFAFAFEHPLVQGDRIGLLGSSMGGFISIFKAASDPRVKAVVLWATPCRLRGAVQDPALGEEFMEDAKGYDAAQAISRVGRCLILHGTEDELVPFSDAEELHRRAQEPKELIPFPRGDHRFTDPEARRRAAELSLGWFKRYL
ncbi:MAG: hypothetical protein DRG55_02390 [Deltaproteobacteria bacterium]|nr:MAG: hypothetical protein DRG69_01920 [Deltaproteobacteria bacterium]RLB02662.1 MAG: hypothetical protein DRG55_02390 [Deltaproteobacteria bacterium]